MEGPRHKPKTTGTTNSWLTNIQADTRKEIYRNLRKINYKRPHDIGGSNKPKESEGKDRGNGPTDKNETDRIRDPKTGRRRTTLRLKSGTIHGGKRKRCSAITEIEDDRSKVERWNQSDHLTTKNLEQRGNHRVLYDSWNEAKRETKKGNIPGTPNRSKPTNSAHNMANCNNT